MERCPTKSTDGLENPIFNYFPEDHPFFLQVSQFRRDIEDWLGRKNQTLEPAVGERRLIRSLIRSAPQTGEGIQLKWLYLSAQYWQEDEFRATTFMYRAGRQRTSVFEFPDDPKLTGPGEYLAQYVYKKRHQKRLKRVPVLRYVPRRRLTILDLNEPERLVGKFVRSSEAMILWESLKRLETNFAPQGEDFQMTKQVRIDGHNALLYQTHQPGIELPAVLSPESISLLRQAGKIEASIHACRFQPGGYWDMDLHRERVVRDVAWISFVCPAQGGLLQNVLRTWLEHAPDIPSSSFVFCHGDFRAAHLLVNDGAPWSVIDFDGCLQAPAEWEIAWFLVSLKRDVPFFFETITSPQRDWPGTFELAEQHFLEGYRAGSPRFSQRRLDWFRLGAEIHHIARSYQRDIVHPLALERTMTDIETLAARLELDKD